MGFTQNSTFGFATAGDPSGGTVTAANNGLSLVGSNMVVLGQNISQSGDPAILLSHREIPMDGFNVLFSGIGNISIGQSTPTYKLDINSSISNIIRFTDGTRNLILDGNGLNTNTVMAIGTNSFESSSLYVTNGASMTNTTLRLKKVVGQTGNMVEIIREGTNADYFTITNLGLVGINNETPTALLDMVDSLTGSNATSTFSIATTWNTSGSPTALFMNVTNTSSGATAKLVDIQQDATSRFTISGAINYLNGQTGFGVTAPNASAKVQIDSTTQGFLPPRMTTTQRDAIATPAAGLVIYNTTTSKINVFTSTWEQVESSLTVNNGLSYTGGAVTLGQDVGEGGNPATLISSREIPMSTFEIHFIGTSGVIGIEGKLAIGIVTAPLFPIHIETATVGSANIAAVNTDSLGATSGGGLTLYAKALPSAANQRIGIIAFGSRNSASADDIGASIESFSNGAWTNGTSHFSRLVFSVTNSGSATPSEVVRISNSRVSIGTGISGTAYLTLRGGTSGANGAPLKFNSGTNMANPETGAMEYDGTNLFFTRTGTTRETVMVGASGATAPATSAGVTIVNFYGASATNYLGDPNSWASVVIAGTTWKIPLYS